MALKMNSASDLRDEIRAATDLRSKHLENVDRLVRRYTTSWYRSDRQPDTPTAHNHAYELMSVLLFAVLYDNPQVDISSDNPHEWDANGVLTAGQYSEALQMGLNRWSKKQMIGNALFDVAVDYFFAWSIVMTTTEDQPGYQSADIIRQWPRFHRIPAEHFVMDASAMTWDPVDANGPRWNGHMWKADKEDLLADPTYDKEAVKSLSVDTDLEKYDVEREGGLHIPKRGEIVGWDIWVPEYQIDGFYPEDGYHGAIFTLAVGHGEGGMSKNPQWLRKPQPAFTPRWGPYTMFGYQKPRNSAFPLSALVATAEKAEELNAHEVAAAEDARAYKKFAAVSARNAPDAEKIKMVRNGEAIVVDAEDLRQSVAQIELGGASRTQLEWVERTRDALNRQSGMSDALRGEVTGDPTATEIAESSRGSTIRLNGLQRRFRMPIQRCYESALFFMFHGDDHKMALGQEGMKLGMTEIHGGRYGQVYIKSKGGWVEYDGRDHWRYDDLTLTVEPWSMEHTDQNVLQRNVMKAVDVMLKMNQQMPTSPWMRWKKPMQKMWDVFNVGSADEWIDFEVLSQVQEMTGGVAGVSGTPGGGQGSQVNQHGAYGAGEQNRSVSSGSALASVRENASMMGAAQKV